jgi:hypothetical protein
MIQEKTKGNLNTDESRILAGTISNLQMGFVEVVQKQPSSEIGTQPEVSQKADQKSQIESAPDQTEADGKKKFVKSYGS